MAAAGDGVDWQGQVGFWPREFVLGFPSFPGLKIETGGTNWYKVKQAGNRTPGTFLRASVSNRLGFAR